MKPPFACFNFGVYMTRARFYDIKFCFHTENTNNPPAEYAGDPLYKLRWLIDKMNGWLGKAVIPGTYLCVDESIVPWDGRGLPFRKSIDRKPHDGWFLWSIAGTNRTMQNMI